LAFSLIVGVISVSKTLSLVFVLPPCAVSCGVLENSLETTGSVFATVDQVSATDPPVILGAGPTQLSLPESVVAVLAYLLRNGISGVLEGA
jgi:hypothetical protein